MTTPEVMAENEVTLKSLEQIFKRAFYDTTVHDEDRVLIVDGESWRLRITLVDDHLKLIRFHSNLQFKESAALDMRYALIRKMNDSVVLCRFYTPEDNTRRLSVDYYLPFKECVLPYQIVTTFRMFCKAVIYAIRTCDTDDLLE